MKYDKKEQKLIIDSSDLKFMDNCYNELMDRSERNNGPKSLYRALQYAAKISTVPDNDYAKAAKALEEAKILEISSDVQDIPDEMFSGNGKGKEQQFDQIILQDGVQRVGKEALKNCTCHSEFNSTKPRRDFDDRALYGFTCPSVNIEGTMTHLGKEVMACSHIDSVKLADYIATSEGMLKDSSVKHLRVGVYDDVTKIADFMCQNCHNLESVEMPPKTVLKKYRKEGTLDIGKSAFENCENVVLDLSNVSCMRENACKNCKKTDVSIQNLENMDKMYSGALAGMTFSTNSITLNANNYSKKRATDVIPGVTETPRRIGLFKKPLTINLTKEPVEDVLFVNLPYFPENFYSIQKEAEATGKSVKDYGNSYVHGDSTLIGDTPYSYIHITIGDDIYEADADVIQNIAVSQTQPDENGVSIVSIRVPSNLVFDKNRSSDRPSRISARDLLNQMSPDDDLRNVTKMRENTAGVLAGRGLDDLNFSIDEQSDKSEHKGRNVPPEMESLTENAEKKKEDQGEDSDDNIPH